MFTRRWMFSRAATYAGTMLCKRRRKVATYDDRFAGSSSRDRAKFCHLSSGAPREYGRLIARYISGVWAQESVNTVWPMLQQRYDLHLGEVCILCTLCTTCRLQRDYSRSAPRLQLLYILVRSYLNVLTYVYDFVLPTMDMRYCGEFSTRLPKNTAIILTLTTVMEHSKFPGSVISERTRARTRLKLIHPEWSANVGSWVNIVRAVRLTKTSHYTVHILT